MTKEQEDQLLENPKPARSYSAQGKPPLVLWTEEECDSAHDEWGANCGPFSIAAALGKRVDEVRPHIPNFRGWMNPTQIGETLRNLGAAYSLEKGLKTQSLCNGINRIQWEGPWLNPGVPKAAAYRQTHWVAHFDGFVLCALIYPYAFLSIETWRRGIERHEKGWHVTHYYRLAAQPPQSPIKQSTL
jgi:hypothetical protein